jgi:hypothetical protein
MPLVRLAALVAVLALLGCGGSSSSSNDGAAAHDAGQTDSPLATDTAADTAQGDGTPADAAGADAGADDGGCALPPELIASPSDAGAVTPRGAVATASGNLTAFVDTTAGVVALRPSGTTWEQHTVFAAHDAVFSQFGGHAVAVDSAQVYTEGDSGAFGAPDTPTGVTGIVAFRAADYHPSNGELFLAGDDEGYDMTFSRHQASGSWQTSSSQHAGGYINVLGVGRLGNGDPWVVYTSQNSTQAAVAPVANMNDVHALGTTTGHVSRVAAPDAATGPAVALWWEPGTLSKRELWGQLWDTTSYATSHSTQLVVNTNASVAGSGSVQVTVLYDQDQQAATYVAWDTTSKLAWIGRVLTTGFEPIAPLRADLVFDRVPYLVRLSCGEAMIVHQSRASSAPAGSAPIRIESLAAFQGG